MGAQAAHAPKTLRIDAVATIQRKKRIDQQHDDGGRTECPAHQRQQFLLAVG